MNNIDFDRKIKEMVDSYQEPVPADVWSGVEAGLNRRKSVLWVKRVSYAAVAASLALVMLLDAPKGDYRGVGDIKVIEAQAINIKADSPKKLAKLELANRAKVATEALLPVEEKVVVGMADVSQMSQNVEPAGQSNSADQSKPVEKAEPVSPVVDDSWAFDDNEPETHKRGVVLGFASNMLALNGTNLPNKGHQYAPGSGLAIQNGIVPITKPTFAIPLTFGVQLQIPVGKRVSVGTGLNYTYLQNSFQALVDNSIQGMVDQKLHYIGLPISLFVNILEGEHFSCYASAGGAIEKGLQVSSRIKNLEDKVSFRNESIKGLQYSVNLGIGLQYSFNELVGIYFDPSLVYYFDSDQPYSVRTSQPFQLDMELGLRFNL